MRSHPSSVLYGWGALMVACAGSYYFARKSMEERREENRKGGIRPKKIRSWQQRVSDAEIAVTNPVSGTTLTPSDKAKAQADLLGDGSKVGLAGSTKGVTSGRGVGMGEGSARETKAV